MIKSRGDARGGGVGLLFDSSLNLNIKARPDLACGDSNVMESMFVQLPQKNSKDIIIGVIYRPPNTDVNLFLSALAVILEVINSENRSCYLAGDFNIDLLNCKQPHGQSFLDQLFSFGFYPRIDRPTRITDTSATLIDNIFTNVHNSELTSGVWIADVSDHLPVYVIMPCLNRRVSREPKYVYKRIYSEDKMIQFRDALCGIDWSDIRATIGVNNMYDKFNSLLNNQINIYFPAIKIKINEKSENKPWITRTILNSINKKNTMYKHYIFIDIKIHYFFLHYIFIFTIK